MAYNSAHTGPQIDAAVEMLGQIQSARDATAADRAEVAALASQVDDNADQVVSQAVTVGTKTNQVLARAAEVEQAHDETLSASLVAVSAKDAAALSESSAQASQASATASASAAAQSQVAAGLSEQISAENAESSSADRLVVETLAQQVEADSESAQINADSAALSALNAAAVVTGGTATIAPSPGKIPLADAQGKIDSGWFGADMARTDAVQAATNLANEGLEAVADIQDPADPTKGATKVGWDGESLDVQLAQAKKLANYTALGNYTGSATRIELTQSGIAGPILRDPTVTAGDGATTFLDGLGRGWRRDFQGDVQASWFGVVGGDTVGRYKAQLQAAINYVSQSKGKLSVAGDVYLEAGLAVPSSTEYHLDFSKAKLIFDAGVGVGVTVGSAGDNPYRGTIAGLNVAKAVAGSGDVGILLLNCVETEIDNPISNNFSKAMAWAPVSASRVAYTTVNNPAFTNHEYGIWVSPSDNTSYANENTVIAGRLASNIAGRLIDQVYLSNAQGAGAQHNRFLGVSMEGFSGSGYCGKAAARMVAGAHQNIFEWCRTEKYNTGWEDGTYVFDATTLGNTAFDTRSDVTFVDLGQNNWWTPLTGFHFNGFTTNQAATPAFKYTRSAPLSDLNTKYAIDLADTYSSSGEVGLLRYTSARGGGNLINVTTTLGSLQMNGACEWTTPSKRSGAVTGASSHGYSVAASVTGATLCAAYHSLKSNEAGNWFLYGEGNAPSYFGGPIRTVGTNGITPFTTFTSALFFSNTSSNNGGVANEYQTNNVANRHHMAFSNPNGVVGSISTNASATSYNTSSDERLKENIEDAGDSGADIDAIRVAQFDWKAGGDHQEYGFIAQELVKVAPYAVSHDPEDADASWGVDYSKLVPMMMKEIQMLRERVKALEG